MPVKAQEFLFANNFNRSDNSDLEASAAGKSGTFGALDWSGKSNSGSLAIVGEQPQFGEDGARGAE